MLIDLLFLYGCAKLFKVLHELVHDFLSFYLGLFFKVLELLIVGIDSISPSFLLGKFLVVLCKLFDVLLVLIESVINLLLFRLHVFDLLLIGGFQTLLELLHVSFELGPPVLEPADYLEYQNVFEQ